MTKKVRIGCAAAFWGDTQTAASQLVHKGKIDYLVSDYLAEITLSIMARQKMKDPKAGYARDFVSPVMQPLLKEIKKQGIKVISNAGGLNPQACRDALLQAAEAEGVEFKIAVVQGDDLMPRQKAVRELGVSEIGSDQPLPPTVVTMNAYLGALPIVRALEAGADIVLTGRIVDSAVTLAPLMHEFGWRSDDYDRLAAGSVAGHIIECGTQCTGGNFTDWESVPGYEDMGFPIVECEASGVFTVSKPAGTGGLVTPATVGEQMLYEIGDPQSYLLPDVVCDFTNVRLEQLGENEVRVWGARGRPPSDNYKVSAIYPAGFRTTAMLMIGGIDAYRKAQRMSEAVLNKVRGLLDAAGLADFSEVSVEILGAEDTYGPHARRQDTREVLVKIAAKHAVPDALKLLVRELPQAATAMVPGITGFFGGRADVLPIPRLFSCLVPKDQVAVSVLIDGEELPVPLPAPGGEATVMFTPVSDERVEVPDPIEVPLVQLAWARSGDKGNHANIGVMARKPEYLVFIRQALTPEAVAQWFAHVLAGKVRRFDLPASNSLNFLLTDALGGGGVNSLRVDPQGKCFGQMLLDHPIPVPRALFEDDAA